MERAEYTSSHCENVLKGYVLPGLPHPLLKPEERSSWKKVRQAYDKVAKEVEELNPDLILIYSTHWVLNH